MTKKELERRIEELERRVGGLEARPYPVIVYPPPAPEPQPYFHPYKVGDITCGTAVSVLS